MSALKDLLKDVPVEWKALGEVANFRRGSFPQPYGNSEWYDGEDSMPFIQVNDVGFNLKLVAKTKNRISKKAQPKSVFVPENTVVVTLQGSIGRVAITQYSSYVDRTLAIFENYKIDINTKYFAYQLEAKFNVEKEKARGNIIKTITIDDFRKFQIPIPYPNDPEKSLAIQQEIVRVLDALTEQKIILTDALASEIASRKKQYDFYREQLFQFEGKEVEWKTLADIGDVKMCKRIFKSETTDEGDIPFYKIGTFGKVVDSFISEELYELYKFKYSYPKVGTVLISAAGTIGRTVVFDGKPAYFQDSNIIWLDNEETIVLNCYLQHYYKIAKWFVSGGGIIDRLYNDNVRKTKISIPFPNDKEKSFREQARIVAILDKFDEATKAIVAELEKEIDLRNKQYEYYRNQLLMFNG